MTEFKTNKLEVTDEMVKAALENYDSYKYKGGFSFEEFFRGRMRTVLEAVFAMLPEAVSANNAQSKDDGWIEWRGGEMPVKWDVLVKVKYRGALHCPEYLPAIAFRWTDYGRIDDIIAYRIIDKPEPTQDNEKWLDYTGTCHPNTGVVKMVRLKDGDVIMLGYADFDNWPDVKAYQLWSEDHEPEPEEYKRYYGHIDKDGNYTFPHDEPQKKENNLELMCDCICHGTICELCAPKPIPTLNQFRKNHSARNNELLVMSEFDYISEYLDKYMKEKD